MLIVKYFLLVLILILFSMIGKFKAKKYVYRLEELEDVLNALNILKNKMKFTYEPIPGVFREISENTCKNIGNIFRIASKKMEKTTASIAWEESVESSNTNLKEEDKQVIKTMSKLLGQTDIDGQVSQIEITEKFLEKQIKEAEEERRKNEKLFTRLGTIMGLAVVIILC